MASSGYLVVAALVVTGCARTQYAAGRTGPFDVSGSFVVQESVVSSTCGADVLRPDPSPRRRPERTRDAETERVDVQHSPGARELTLFYRGEPYPARIEQDGQFRVENAMHRNGTVTTRTSIHGRFRDSTMTAYLSAVRMEDRDRLTARTQGGSCSYKVDLSGVRLRDP